MKKCIIYQNDEGGVTELVPSDNCGLSIEGIAAKDVPTGKPYKIVDVADLPTDQSVRDAWTIDESDLTDGVGADYGNGSVNAVIGYDDEGTPITKDTSK